MTVQTALSWSGGKDSALALWDLRREGVEPGALITTVTDTYERISITVFVASYLPGRPTRSHPARRDSHPARMCQRGL